VYILVRKVCCVVNNTKYNRIIFFCINGDKIIIIPIFMSFRFVFLKSDSRPHLLIAFCTVRGGSGSLLVNFMQLSPSLSYNYNISRPLWSPNVYLVKRTTFQAPHYLHIIHSSITVHPKFKYTEQPLIIFVA
jgi:hypothetical protein